MSGKRPEQVQPPGTDLALRASSFSVSPMQSLKLDKDSMMLINLHSAESGNIPDPLVSQVSRIDETQTMGPDEEQPFNRVRDERLIMQGQGGSTSQEEEEFHPNPVALKAQVASGDNVTFSSRNNLMGTITLSQRIDEDDHKAV